MAPAMFDRSENSSNVAMEALVSCDWHMWLTNIFAVSQRATYWKFDRDKFCRDFLVEFYQYSASGPQAK